METSFAEQFATEWIDAWNARDLDRVLGHYTDDFEMVSPLIVRTMGEVSGALKGKMIVGRYWRKALSLLPDVRFELISVLTSPRSIALIYKGARGRLVAEVFQFDGEGKVRSAVAHYTA